MLPQNSRVTEWSEAMRGRPFTLTWSADDSEEALKAAYLAERNGVIRTRLRALWRLRAGRSLTVVTAAVGVHYRTVQRWVEWYRGGGVALVRSRRMGGVGRTPFLTRDTQEQVAQDVASGRFRTAAENRGWIATTYHAEYTVGGIYTLLGRLGCGLRVPRPVHPRTDLTQQEAWKKTCYAVSRDLFPAR
jgi:transposase